LSKYLTNDLTVFIMLRNIASKYLLNRLCEVETMQQLCEKVRELRTKKGWAQEHLAREIGVSLSTVQRWEKRGGRPTYLARRELIRLFKEAGIKVE
jgi:DNA-binding transcriptional regulator YiaG